MDDTIPMEQPRRRFVRVRERKMRVVARWYSPFITGCVHLENRLIVGVLRLQLVSSSPMDVSAASVPVSDPATALRKWPAVTISLLVLAAVTIPSVVAPGTIIQFYGMNGSFISCTSLREPVCEKSDLCISAGSCWSTVGSILSLPDGLVYSSLSFWIYALLSSNTLSHFLY